MVVPCGFGACKQAAAERRLRLFGRVNPTQHCGSGFCEGQLCPRAWAHLATDARLLQQVLLDLGALDGTPLVEVDVNVLPEAA